MKKKGLKAVQTQSLVELAYKQLLEGITSGHFNEKDRIVIDTVAEELGISRIPVREALARLHAQKLLSYERNKGYKVLPKDDYGVLFQARLVIEPSAIKFCNNEITDKDIHKLREINTKISRLIQHEKSRQYMDFFILNDQFHATIITLCGNRLISEAYEGLSYGPQWARHAFAVGVPDLKENVLEHEAIISALEQGDLDKAATLSGEHILNGLERFKFINRQIEITESF
jgi:DNA-binding GntR family transcriptional regulator